MAVQGKSGQLKAVLSSEPSAAVSRRAAVAGLVGASTLAFWRAPANALDMDAFVNSELEKDTKQCNPKFDPKCAPKMSPDEAMCKYGQSGEARGEACKRYKSSGGSLAKPGSAGTSPGGAYQM